MVAKGAVLVVLCTVIIEWRSCVYNIDVAG